MLFKNLLFLLSLEALNKFLNGQKYLAAFLFNTTCPTAEAVMRSGDFGPF